MKRILILGASGIIGGRALRYALESPNVRQVLSVGRNELGFSHPKLIEVQQPQLSDCSSLSQSLSSQDAVVACLGASTSEASREKLGEIALSYTGELARVLADSRPRVRFSFLQVDCAELARVAYTSVSMAGLNAFVQAEFSQTYIFRPAYRYPMHACQEARLGARVMTLAKTAFHYLGFPTRSDVLARAMLNTSMREED